MQEQNPQHSVQQPDRRTVTVYWCLAILSFVVIAYLIHLLRNASSPASVAKPSVLSSVRDNTPQNVTASLRHLTQVGSHQPPRDDALVIIPLPNVDEKEFLLFVYGTLKQKVPYVVANGHSAIKDCSELRDELNRYLDYIKGKMIDERLVSLYSNLLDRLEVVNDYQINLDRIDRAILNQARQDLPRMSFNAGLIGGTAAADVRNNGGSGKEAAVAALFFTGAGFLLDKWQKDQALDESKRQALESATEAFKRKMSPLLARESNALDVLGKEYQWRRDDQGNYVDSFTQRVRGLAEQYEKVKTREEAHVVSNAILEAARSVPVDSLYDKYRADALYWTARLETWALEQECGGREWGSKADLSGDHASSLWRTVRRYEPKDLNGLIRSQHAWALAMSGRFVEAKQLANEVFLLQRSSPTFLYYYVCLYSSSGMADETTLANLRTVLSNGTFCSAFDRNKEINVSSIRYEPNLQRLRQKYPEQLTHLLKVKYTSRIKWGKWGILKDDIELTNQSAFPLTNVVLSLHIESNGKVWDRLLTATSIAAGSNFTWPREVSIPKSRVDKFQSELVCDQNK